MASPSPGRAVKNCRASAGRRAISGRPCGAEANAAKFLGARAGFDSCMQAVLTHGGFGYAEEFPISRYYRDVRLITIGGGTSEIMKEILSKRLGWG